MTEDIADTETARTPHGTWAAVAVTVSLCLVLASFLIDAQRANTGLSKIDKAQTEAVAGTGKAETQLNSLARGVQALANGGNANAAAIVALLQRNGVKINAR